MSASARSDEAEEREWMIQAVDGGCQSDNSRAGSEHSATLCTQTLIQQGRVELRSMSDGRCSFRATPTKCCGTTWRHHSERARAVELVGARVFLKREDRITQDPKDQNRSARCCRSAMGKTANHRRNGCRQPVWRRRPCVPAYGLQCVV